MATATKETTLVEKTVIIEEAVGVQLNMSPKEAAALVCVLNKVGGAHIGSIGHVLQGICIACQDAGTNSNQPLSETVCRQSCEGITFLRNSADQLVY